TITVDLPPEEASEFVAALRKRGVDAIFLLAPTSPPERMQRITEMAGGFIYYVSLRGVTGAAHLDVAEIADKLKAIRRYGKLPVGVGFGIDSPERAARVATVADAVIVGSAIVKRMEERMAQPDRILADVPAFLATLRQAMDAGQNDGKVSGAKP
ncbi:MAG TPA: tryptophan synthase subunit alpha, partial [Burkholderiales bacterium]|nr:tryptophan synthase subunit alpha [Burkholderiales bacterium]